MKTKGAGIQYIVPDRGQFNLPTFIKVVRKNKMKVENDSICQRLLKLFRRNKMKGKLDKKAIKQAAIELETMIEKYINDYPEVQQVKNCYADYIEMAKKEEICTPIGDIPRNPYWFTDTPLAELSDLSNAHAEFFVGITISPEELKELFAFLEDEQDERENG